MDELTKSRIVEFYKSGKGINYISKVFKIKKDKIGKILENELAYEVGQKVGPEVVLKEEVAMTIIKPTEDKSSTNVVLEGIDVSMLYLNKNIDVLRFMIEKFKESNEFETKDRKSIIEIRLPNDDSNYKTSIRVNKFIMEQFREFANEHKEFTTKDLISMALLEYMDRYR